MSDSTLPAPVEDFVRRLRLMAHNLHEPRPGFPSMHTEAADALEAQQATITALREPPTRTPWSPKHWKD